MRFRDRAHAGRELVSELPPLPGEVLVLALPRGGVPVAAEVARALGAPMDVFAVRKLGVPGREELAFGAVARGGVRFIDRSIAARVGLDDRAIEAVTARERAELERREAAYHDRAAALDLRGKTVLLVDDGLATGATMRAAITAARAAEPAAIVVAVPVAAPEVAEAIGELADGIACVTMPPSMGAVGQWYEDFSQTSDEEVRALLHDAGRPA